jgi:hypothetical protein
MVLSVAHVVLSSPFVRFEGQRYGGRRGPRTVAGGRFQLDGVTQEAVMGDEGTTMQELDPVRYRTAILTQIEQLCEERRQILRTITRFGDPFTGRHRITEIDKQLSELWQIRRGELR